MLAESLIQASRPAITPLNSKGKWSGFTCNLFLTAIANQWKNYIYLIISSQHLMIKSTLADVVCLPRLTLFQTLPHFHVETHFSYTTKEALMWIHWIDICMNRITDNVQNTTHHIHCVLTLPEETKSRVRSSMTPLFPARLSVSISVESLVDSRTASTAMQTARVVDAFMMSHCQLTTQQDMWLASAFSVWWSLFQNVTIFQSNTSNYQASETSEICIIS